MKNKKVSKSTIKTIHIMINASLQFIMAQDRSRTFVGQCALTPPYTLLEAS